jgi:dimethylaniline monooxygenase (N-oxide forming)
LDLKVTNLDYPAYVPHEKIKQYLEEYSEKFGLKKHIRFRHDVVRLEQITNGTWQVSTKSTLGIQDWRFDKVILATGRHQTPIWPKIEGLEDFRGSLTHVAKFVSRMFI